jgi:hypothetical protein
MKWYPVLLHTHKQARATQLVSAVLGCGQVLYIMINTRSTYGAKWCLTRE